MGVFIPDGSSPPRCYILPWNLKKLGDIVGIAQSRYLQRATSPTRDFPRRTGAYRNDALQPTLEALSTLFQKFRFGVTKHLRGGKLILENTRAAVV